MPEQLVELSQFNPDKLIFEAFTGKSQTNATYTKVNVFYDFDGEKSGFLLKIPKCWSFGFQENTDFNDKSKINGHLVTICIGEREGGLSEDQQQWLNVMEKFFEKANQWMFENRVLLKKPKAKEDFFDISNCIKYKEDHQGNRIPNTNPLYSLKVKSFKTKPEKGQEWDGTWDIKTRFWEKVQGERPQKLDDPFKYVGLFTNCVTVVKLDNVFIGNACYLQSKLVECQFDHRDKVARSFLDELEDLSEPPGKAPYKDADETETVLVDNDPQDDLSALKLDAGNSDAAPQQDQFHLVDSDSEVKTKRKRKS